MLINSGRLKWPVGGFSVPIHPHQEYAAKQAEHERQVDTQAHWDQVRAAVHQDQEQPMDPQRMYAATMMQKVHVLRIMAMDKQSQANLLNEAAMALEMLMKDNRYAQQEREAGKNNVGSGAQSPVRQEGGYTYKGR